MMLVTVLFLTLGAEPQLKVTAKDTVSFDVAALEKLGLEKKEWTEKGAKHVVEGVPLEKVLAAAGWGDEPRDGGVKSKHTSWRQVVVARAGDGYNAVFSGGEIAAALGLTRVLVVTRQDGAPLSGKLGKFRLVVLSDVEPARSIFQLESITVTTP